MSCYKRMFFLISILILISLQAAIADEETTLILAGHMLDVENGKMLKQQSILIKNGIIVHTGPQSKITKANYNKIIDLQNKTLLPGLIDLHTHLTKDHSLHGYKRLAVSNPRRTIYGVVNAEKTLLAGFTTVRNLGAAGYTDIALRDAINDGLIRGPRIFASGPALGITGGHCDSNLLPPEFKYQTEGIADGPWAVRAKVREVIKFGADVIKFCGTGGVLSKGTQIGSQQYTFTEMQALINEAHLHGRTVAVHAHSNPGIKTAIKAGVDSIEHASLIDAETIDLAKKHQTILVMDVYVSDYILNKGPSIGIFPESLEKEKIVGQKQRANFKLANKAGAIIAFGSDAGIYPHGDNAKQFFFMTQNGMTPLQAIRAATINAAKLLKPKHKIGIIKSNAYADLIAVDGNPLKNIRLLENVTFVMKNGQIIKHNL